MKNLFDFSWMNGRQLKVSFSEPESWFFDLGSDCGIRADCPWRLIRDGRILVSSADHKQQYGLPAPIDAAEKATSFLTGMSIRGTITKAGTADLMIELTEGHRLEILPFSTGYESWGINGPKGEHVFAQGGGDISGYE